MKNISSRSSRKTAFMAVSLIIATGYASMTQADPAPPAQRYSPPQASTSCLDLGKFLSQIRELPDSLYFHHPLINLDLQPVQVGAVTSVSAVQHALDLFYHPNLTTLGIAAAKQGTGFQHTFMAYQNDCSKVVTGNIFADEGMAVTWEIHGHTANSLTLKRISQGGQAEPSPDLTLVMRRFQALAPTAFAVTSAYSLKTTHACPSPAAQIDETNVLTVTEIFVINSFAAEIADPANDSLKALLAANPRLPATDGFRGEYVNPVTRQTDAVCTSAPVVPVAPTALPVTPPTVF